MTSPMSIIAGNCGPPEIWATEMEEVRRGLTLSATPELAEFTVDLLNKVRQPLPLEIAWPSGLPADQRRTIEAQCAAALEGALVRYHVWMVPVLIDAVDKIGLQICERLRKMRREAN